MFKHFPFAKETLRAALNQMVKAPSDYRICCFNGRGRLQSCDVEAGNIKTSINVMHYELNVQKTLPTPSFLRKLAGCVFLIESPEDREIAEFLLERQLKQLEVVFTCYGTDDLKPKLQSQQTEIRLYENNIQEQILLYLNSH